MQRNEMIFPGVRAELKELLDNDVKEFPSYTLFTELRDYVYKSSGELTLIEAAKILRKLYMYHEYDLGISISKTRLKFALDSINEINPKESEDIISVFSNEIKLISLLKKDFFDDDKYIDALCAKPEHITKNIYALTKLISFDSSLFTLVISMDEFHQYNNKELVKFMIFLELRKVKIEFNRDNIQELSKMACTFYSILDLNYITRISSERPDKKTDETLRIINILIENDLLQSQIIQYLYHDYCLSSKNPWDANCKKINARLDAILELNKQYPLKNDCLALEIIEKERTNPLAIVKNYLRTIELIKLLIISPQKESIPYSALLPKEIILMILSADFSRETRKNFSDTIRFFSQKAQDGSRNNANANSFHSEQQSNITDQPIMSKNAYSH